ncbi:hypothetical protein DL93DRAFT_2088423 [Clavulina sp. PMI_390]|nr:hypothetical protein DL93DRAFT_2088423 [Clavulina sp. PMI_390]
MEEYPPPEGELDLDFNFIASLLGQLHPMTSKHQPVHPMSRHRTRLESALDGLANILTTNTHHIAVSVVHPKAEPSSYEIWLAEGTKPVPSSSLSPPPSPSLVEASEFAGSLLRQLATVQESNIDTIRGGDLRFPHAYLHPLPSLNINTILPPVYSMFERMWPRFVQVFTKSDDMTICCEVADLVTNGGTSPRFGSVASLADAKHHFDILKDNSPTFHAGKHSISQVVGRLARACQTSWPDDDAKRQDILWNLAMLSNIYRTLSNPKNCSVIESWNFLASSTLPNVKAPLSHDTGPSILHALNSLVSMFDDMNAVMRIVLLPVSLSPPPAIRPVTSHFNECPKYPETVTKDTISQILSLSSGSAGDEAVRDSICTPRAQHNEHEVALLLAMHGIDAIPYIGIHQPPSRATHILFRSFRASSEMQIQVRAGDATPDGWCFPSISMLRGSVEDAWSRRGLYENIRMIFWMFAKDAIRCE